MQSHPYQTIALPNGAKLLFTPCPGTKGVSLEATLEQFKRQKVTLLLTLMFDNEMTANHIETLPTLCQQQHIAWFQLPIVDDQAPSAAFEQQWQKHQQNIVEVLANKGTVAVHCKGGTGRTGTVISLILLRLGWSMAEIVKTVQQVKPKALTIAQQLDYLNAQEYD